MQPVTLSVSTCTNRWLAVALISMFHIASHFLWDIAFYSISKQSLAMTHCTSARTPKSMPARRGFVDMSTRPVRLPSRLPSPQYRLFIIFKSVCRGRFELGGPNRPSSCVPPDLRSKWSWYFRLLANIDFGKMNLFLNFNISGSLT
jgi:hypothetical protein